MQIYNEEGSTIEAKVQVTGDSGKGGLNRRTDREGRLELSKLKTGEYKILASADGYYPARAEFAQRGKQVNITMKTTALVTGPTPFPLAGWGDWGDISVESAENTITVNGAPDTAGYANTRISTGLAGKKLILDIENSGASRYSNSRMFKMTVKRGGLP
jgi:hypothetical protein